MARLFIIGTSDDVDITMGLRMLFEQGLPTEVVLPLADANETHDQIIIASSEKNVPVRTGDPLDVLMNQITSEDVIAVAWDDSDEAFEAVEFFSGKGFQIWDISDGLTLIDTETEALEEKLSEVLEDFTDSLVAIVFKMVMDQINGEGKYKYRRPHDLS
jgi:hypothetical protein